MNPPQSDGFSKSVGLKKNPTDFETSGFATKCKSNAKMAKAAVCVEFSGFYFDCCCKLTKFKVYKQL